MSRAACVAVAALVWGVFLVVVLAAGVPLLFLDWVLRPCVVFLGGRW